MCKTLFISFISLFFISACNDDNDHPEQVEKLKPILVEMNAGVSIPTERSAILGQNVTLDFHFLAPLESTLSNPRVLTAAGSFTAVPLTGVAVGAVTQNDYPGLRHFVVRVEGKIPSLESFGDLGPAIIASGFVGMRYQLVVFDGLRDINVVGDFPAYVDRSKVDSTANFADAAITKPVVDGAASGAEFDIGAAYTNPFDEDVKISWLITGDSEINNHRALETKVKLPGPGSYTLVFTIRGQKSKATALRFRTITL